MGGLFLSCREISSNLILMSFFTVILCGNTAFSVMKSRRYEEEKFDEMATENLNKASRKVILDLHVICVIILLVDVMQDILKYAFSFIIPWKEYFTITPLSCVLILLGFQALMTGIHFRRLERE